MAIWGDKQLGTWEAVATEEVFLPDVVYQLSYTLPEKPWWGGLLPWLWPYKTEWLRDAIVKAIAATTEIPEEEIQVLWFFYNEADNTFQIQIRWAPAPEAGAIPAAGPISITLTIIILAITTTISLFFFLRIVEELTPHTIEKLVEEMPEVIKKVVEEMRRSISWLTVLAGIAVTGSLVSLFVPRRKKA